MTPTYFRSMILVAAAFFCQGFDTFAQQTNVLDAIVVEFSEGGSGSSLIVTASGVKYGFCLYGNCGAPMTVVGQVTQKGTKVRIWYKSRRRNSDGSIALVATRVESLTSSNPSGQGSQTSASKTWPTFWTEFTSAVKAKNRTALKGLMASESEFFPGSGNTGRDDWLDMLRDSNMWKDVQKSISKGVMNYNENGKIGRTTRDRNLIFQFIHNRWRFVGIMGD